MAILTINHYINEANSFITDIRNNRNGYYMFASASQPWTNSEGNNDDASILAANNSVAQVEQSIYRDLLYGKLLKDEDVNHLAPRYNWTIDTIYDVYDQNDANLYSKQFFVVTDKYEVYKCIDNNNRANSYVKPTLTTSSGTFKTGDGYVWKYMYTIDSTSNTKFTTSGYIPVVTNTAVQGNTIPGSIDVIKITDGGNSYYVYESGYISGMVNPYTVQLSANTSGVDNYYVNSSIYLKSGFGAGQVREISSSNGVSKQIFVTNPFTLHTRLDLANVVGTIIPGYLATQSYDIISYLYPQGYFNVNAPVAQSDTGITGTIVASNSSVIQVTKYYNNQTKFSNNYPIVDTTQSGTLKTGTVSVGNVGACNLAIITSNGSGYTANATVTISNNGPTGVGAVANAQANSTGKITSINISNVGFGYFDQPSLTISAPTAQTFNADTAVTGGTGSGSNNIINLTRLDNISLSGGTALGYNNNDIITVKSVTTNATVTFTTNSTGGNIAFTITNAGSGFNLVGTIPVSNIAITNATGGTAAGNSTVTYLVANVTSVSNAFVINDLITYTTNTGNVAIGGLSSGSSYYIEFANSTVIALKPTITGTRITLTKGANQTGHILQGQTATAVMYCDNQLVYGSNTQLNSAANGYANGEYIRVGANTTSNIRRVINNVNTTVIAVDFPFSNSFSATGSLATISFSGGTASGYNNNDIIIIKSPIVGSTNARATFTTNSTGGSLTLTIANTGSGFLLGNVPVSNIAITNSTGGTATGNSAVTYFVANVDSANSHYKMPVVAEPTLVFDYNVSGYISNTNLNSVKIALTNSSLSGVYFTVGEKVNMVDSSLVNQGANGIIAYANSSTAILSGVLGTWLANSGGNQFYVSGESSLQRSQIVSIETNPNITINNPVGDYKLGYPIFFKDSFGFVSNAMIVAKMDLPNDQTEYQIGPTVKITGDGSNAAAIAIVNTAANSVYDIVGVDIINPGSGYTRANISIYSNTGFGLVGGATARPIISPVYGHGYDAVSELGGRYVGINAKFDTISNESYEFLPYGSYRKVGILQNPQFKDIRVTLTDFDRVNLNLTNKITTNPNTSINNWIPNEAVYQTTSNTTLAINYSLSNGTFNIGDSVYNNVAPTVNGTVTFANSTTVILTLSNTLPASVTASFNANTDVIGAVANISNNTIQIGSNATYLSTNNLITYKVSTGNTAIGGLSNNGQYYIQFANATHIALKSSISSNTRLTLVPSSISETGHIFTAGYLIGNRLISSTANANIDAAYPIISLSNVSASGIVVYGNSSFLQLKSVKGSFTQNSAFNGIVGVYSNTAAFVTSANTIYFPVGNSAEIITQSNSGSIGVITSIVNNTVYFMSNVVGQFADGDVMYDSIVNAYATVADIYTANGTKDVSASFGNRFNQTARITLTANTRAFIDNEYVKQDITLATARVVSSTYEKDLVVSSMSPANSFVIGQTVTDTTTNANGICTFANSTYLKLTAVSQNLSFSNTHTINNGSGSTATINNVFPVLILNDVSDINNFQVANAIVGSISGASGISNNYLLFKYPDLVRDSGKLIYSESFAPVTRSPSTKEEFKLVIKF